MIGGFGSSMDAPGLGGGGLIDEKAARYEERPVGVWDRKAGELVLPGSPQWIEYQAHLSSGGELAPQPAPPALSIEYVRAEKVAGVENLAGQIRRRVVGRATPAEMASWTMKVQQAQAYLASSNPADAPLLGPEATARGSTVDAIVARVMNNALAYERAESIIAGVAGRHKDTIRGLATVEELLSYDIEAGWSPYWP